MSSGHGRQCDACTKHAHGESANFNILRSTLTSTLINTPFTNHQIQIIKAGLSHKILSLLTAQPKIISTFLVLRLLPLSSPEPHQMRIEELMNDLSQGPA